MKPTLLLILILLTSGLLATCSPHLPEPIATPPPIAPSPTLLPPVELEVKDLHGGPARLSDYRGKTALVTFWASWCTACNEELPILEAFYRDHQDEDFVLIGVNTSESPEDAAAYIAEQGYTFVAWSDPAGNEMIKVGARGLPYSFLVDREGHRIATWYGGATEEFLEEAVGLGDG